MIMNPEDYKTAQYNLTSYATLMWQDYLTPPHVQKLASYLELVSAGEVKRLLVIMPPRHSKSLNVAQYFPAWYMGHHPQAQVIYSTYSQDQANKYGRLVRNQLKDPRFNAVFDGCHISDDSAAKDTFTTIEGGEYHALGRGAGLTGKGADLLVLDDMIKDHIEAASAAVRKNSIDWYKSTATTRLQKDAAIILCGTCWNEEDLIGWVLKNNADEGWVILHFPALDETEQHALWPEMFSVTALKAIKARLGPYFWNALYLGRPSAMEGNILKRNRWRKWQTLPKDVSIYIQSWDTKLKETVKGAYAVGQVWGYRLPDFFLLHQIRKRMGANDTIKELFNVSALWPAADCKVIEEKANGPAVMELIKSQMSGVVPFNPDEYGSKEARAQVVSFYQEAGNIFLPEPTMAGYDWVADFIDRCANFPNTPYKDEIDAMSQAIIYLTGGQNSIIRLQNLLRGFE